MRDGSPEPRDWYTLGLVAIATALFAGCCVCIHCDRKAGIWIPGFNRGVDPKSQKVP
jgi:hypothetical protein